MKQIQKNIKKIEDESDLLGPGVDLGPSRALTDAENEALDIKSGLQMISLRLPARTVEKLKILAEKDGLKYQPYLRRHLIKHADEGSSGVSQGPELDARIRRIVRDELGKTGT